MLVHLDTNRGCIGFNRTQQKLTLNNCAHHSQIVKIKLLVYLKKKFTIVNTVYSVRHA